MLNKSGLQHLSYRSIERLFYFILNVSTYLILSSIAGKLDFSLYTLFVLFYLLLKFLFIQSRTFHSFLHRQKAIVDQ